MSKFQKVPEESLEERLKIFDANGKKFQWWKHIQVGKVNLVYHKQHYPIDITAFHANSVDIEKMKTYLHPSDVGTNFLTVDDSVPVGMLWIDMEHVFFEPSTTDTDFDGFMQEELCRSKW